MFILTMLVFIKLIMLLSMYHVEGLYKVVMIVKFCT